MKAEADEFEVEEAIQWNDDVRLDYAANGNA
jgi:hypothetical protein